MEERGLAIAPGTADALIEALVQLAKGEFSVRLARNFRRDTDDALAYFVNLLAEELDRLFKQRDQMHRELAAFVNGLSERFLALAAGDFAVRAPRTGRGDPMDVLSFLFNNTAAEVGAAFGDLEAQRTTLEAILDSMIDGVLLLDASANIQRSNSAMARMLGVDPLTLRGRPFSSILAESEHSFSAGLVSAVEEGPFRDRSTTFLGASGEPLVVAVNGSPQRSGAAGAITGVVLVARDDRELRRAEAHLRMTDRLTAMGTVAAGVAHEVNNPLAYVLSNLDYVLEVLRASPDGPPRSELPEMIEALEATRVGAHRVRHIVRDLKTFSRSDDSEVQAIDINALLDSSLTMMKNEVRHHAKLIKSYGTVPLVEANEARLGQVFINLVQNAAQSIPEGNVEANHVRVTTGTDEDGMASIEIEDSGCGIPQENLQRIFDAFFTTKPVGVGTGLGLAICHNTIRSLGGRIEVESKVGIGTRMRLHLPAATSVALGAVAASIGPAATQRTSPRRILVVDDEPEIGLSIRRLLSQWHDVDVVNRGAAALDLLATVPYDLILCDLMMPEMTGMELYARIEALHPELVARVVLMTGGAFSPGAQKFLDNVPNERIRKPFDAAVMRELVNGRLARATPLAKAC